MFPQLKRLFPKHDFKALIYDLDGTIIHTEPIADEATTACLKTFGLQFSDDERLQCVGKSWPDILRAIVKRNADIVFNVEALEMAIGQRYLSMLDEHLPVLPGAVESIKLFSKHLPLGLVTGSSRSQIDYSLGRLKLIDCFSHTLGIEEYDAGKPSPSGYLLCSQLLGVPAHECLVFEDSTPGIASAKAAGMQVLAIKAGSHPRQNLKTADAQIESFAALIS